VFGAHRDHVLHARLVVRADLQLRWFYAAGSLPPETLKSRDRIGLDAKTLISISVSVSKSQSLCRLRSAGQNFGLSRS